MINNEWIDCKIITYADTVDAYGQIRKGTSTETSTQLVIKPYMHNNIDNPLFIDVTNICLFKTNENIEITNQIKIENKYYNILYIQKDRRYIQVFVRMCD